MAAVGILRLIDEDMVDALIELVAYPVGDAGPNQQRCGMGDEVVIIDRPYAPLGRFIGGGISAPGLQPPGDQIGISGPYPQSAQLRQPFA